MSPRREFQALASRPLVVALLAALLLAASGAELWRLSDRRQTLQQRTQANVQEARAASLANGLVAMQGDAIRDLVLATTPAEIGDAERRFEALARRYADAQAALLGRFAADADTTADERVLLGRVVGEQLATVQPVERVVALARRNEDAAATRILVEEALPHVAELQQALSELAVLQAEQNRALEEGSDTRGLEMALTALLGALAALLAAALRRAAPRRGAASGAFVRPARGLAEGRAASNEGRASARHRDGFGVVRSGTGTGTGVCREPALPANRMAIGAPSPLSVSTEERARALLAGRGALEMLACVDGPDGG